MKDKYDFHPFFHIAAPNSKKDQKVRFENMLQKTTAVFLMILSFSLLPR